MELLFEKLVESLVKTNTNTHTHTIDEMEKVWNGNCKEALYMVIMYDFSEDLYPTLLKKIRRIASHVTDLNNIYFPRRYGLLMMIARYNDAFHIEIAKILLEYGLKIDNVDVDGYTALHYAVQSQNRAFLKFLLERGADVNLPDEKGNYPIMTAIMMEDLELVQILIHNHAQLDVCSDEGLTPLYLMIQKQFIDLVLETMDKMEDSTLHAVTNEGFSILMVACEMGDIRVVKRLLKRGLNLYEKSYHGWNAMHYAASHGNMKVVELLHKHGMDINILTDKKEPPLFMVRPDYIESFLEISSEIDLGYTSSHGENILHYMTSLKKTNLYAIQMLIERGVNMNQRNRMGNTPLHNACINNQQYVVEILLRAGAIADIPNNNGIYPCHICAIKHFTEILAMFYVKDPSLFYLEIDNHLNVYHILGLKEESGRKFQMYENYEQMIVEVCDWIQRESTSIQDEISL